MKENDIVTLINLKKDYLLKNLYLDVKGVILKILPYDKLQIIFFNDNIIGDYAVVVVDKIDVKKLNLELPSNFISELKKSDKLAEKNINNKQSLEKLTFKECEMVELLVENEKYAKHGIHKGDTGYIAINYMVSNSILVDFSGINKNGEYYGDCISVNVKDLKKIK